MPRILALAPYPNESADTRYRITQFIPTLKTAGWEVDLQPFMNQRLFHIYNQPGNLPEKILFTGLGFLKRVFNIINTIQYDGIWLHKEAFAFGPPWFEKALSKRVNFILYDMDDAFWTHPPQFRQIGSRIRDPQRIQKMLGLSQCVLAGNRYLQNFAQQFAPWVELFPTVLDTERYKIRNEIDDGWVTIGWVGRWSSAPYLSVISRSLESIIRKFPQTKIKLIGADQNPFPESIPVEIVPWRLDEELKAISAFDIGIMPLPDDEYSKGKCGFKLLQYMALGIPGVASPVGVNSEIIQDGENGFLAANETEWTEKLSRLVENYSLRRNIGIAGHTTVEKQFSLKHVAPRLIEIINVLNQNV